MPNHSLFSVVGIEIEYMLVHQNSLNVAPSSDVLLGKFSQDTLQNEVMLDQIAMSNELVMHVIELKNNGPKAPEPSIVDDFQQAIQRLQPYLAEQQLQLLPTGAHPWMDPHRETQRWPHDNREIYQQYDTIFNCQGHGWSNLQSMHVNLPYANDAEFFLLHSAIRVLLPLLPALAASTPFLDGKPTGMLDSRLYYYGINQARIPSISGQVIPEFVRSPSAYQQDILQPMYRDIAPFDPTGTLQESWLNSRGAIPKFDYQAIEIRILDSQECVQADYAIAKLIVEVLRHWLNQSHYVVENPCEMERLIPVYQQSIHHGLATRVDDQTLSLQWGLKRRVKTCRDAWSQLIEQVSPCLDNQSQRVLETILSQGNLSERMLRSGGNSFKPESLPAIYRQLQHCLLTNQQFTAL